MHRPSLNANRPDLPTPRRAPLASNQPANGARRVLRADAPHALADLPVCSDFFLAVEQAKLDAMKELAYGASHEINNPLANIAARAQTLLRREQDLDKRKMLQAIHRQAMRAHEMISDLMLFARPPRLEKHPVDLVQCAQRVIGELQELAQERGVTLTSSADSSSVTAIVDQTQVEAALSAVVLNAIEALSGEGHVAIDVRPQDADSVEITVRDNGPGIAEDIREHLFDPFYSGREAGRGLGFGLSKCWRIITEHGGRVQVDSPPSGGALFTLRLPTGP